MVRKSKPKKPEEKEVAGSTGLQGSTHTNPPVHGDGNDSKRKGKFNERKEIKEDETAAETLMGLKDSSVKKDPVLDGNNDPETHTHRHKALKFAKIFPSHWEFYDSGLPPDDDVKFEPLFARDASGMLVPAGIRRIQSPPSAELEKMDSRQEDDTISSDDPPDEDAQKETVEDTVVSTKKETVDDPPDEDAQKETMEETVVSTKKKKKNKKKKKKNQNQNQEEEETVAIPGEEEKEPDGIRCVICREEIPAEKMRRAAKCGHYFGSDCIEQYLLDKQQDEADAYAAVGCPKKGCKETLSDEEIFVNLGEEVRFKWLTFKNNLRINKLEARFTTLKNVAREFLTMLSRIR